MAKFRGTKCRKIIWWPYDLFPYCISSEVTKENSTHYLLGKSWGPNTGYPKTHVLKALPLKEGKALQKRIKVVEAIRKAHLDAINEVCDDHIESLVPGVLKRYGGR